MRNARRARAGFTLIELLVVVVIIGILATIATKGYQSAMDRARNSGMISNTRTVQLAIENWKTDHSSVPSKLLDTTPSDAIGPVGDGSGNVSGNTGNFPIAYLPGNRVPKAPWCNISQDTNGDWGNVSSSNVQSDGSCTAGSCPLAWSDAFGPSGIILTKNGLYSDGGENQKGVVASVPDARKNYGYIYFLADVAATRYAVFGVGKAGNSDNNPFVVCVKANF